jgi:hypothetical protein
MRYFLTVIAAVTACGVLWAAAPTEREEIFLLALERVRAAPQDYQRAVKTAEVRLKDYYAGIKAGAPAAERDIQLLTGKAQKMRLLRGRGQNLPQDPAAQDLIARGWDAYRLEFDGIVEETKRRRDSGEPVSQVFWDATQKFASLKDRTAARLVWNAPDDGGKSLEKRLAGDEVALLKWLEPADVKTRGPGTCVVGPHDEPRAHSFDAGPFYHSQGLLPGQSPTAKGAFTVPAACRTVTQREFDEKLIFRVSQGRGLAYVGGSEAELKYGYILIPPDQPYYFENTGTEPLYLEFIGLPR